jgi:hypothetical protein
MNSHWRAVEGVEGLSADRPRVWGAKLRALQTLHWAPARIRAMEGLEGLEVNRPHARSEKLQTLKTLHCMRVPAGRTGGTPRRLIPKRENTMAAGDTEITIAGNLVDDPELRFTPFPREFSNSEALVGLNRRVAVVNEAIWGRWFGERAGLPPDRWFLGSRLGDQAGPTLHVTRYEHRTSLQMHMEQPRGRDRNPSAGNGPLDTRPARARYWCCVTNGDRSAVARRAISALWSAIGP